MIGSQDEATKRNGEVPDPAAPAPTLGPGARIEDERNTIAVFKQASASTVFVTQTRTVTDYLGSEQEVPAGSGTGFVWDDTLFHWWEPDATHDELAWSQRVGAVVDRFLAVQ